MRACKRHRPRQYAGHRIRQCAAGRFKPRQYTRHGLRPHAALCLSHTARLFNPAPRRPGTGLQPSVLLFLPALQQGGAVEQLSGDVAQLGFSLRGLFDSAIDPAGACYELTNRISFGISEADAVKNLLSISGQLCTRERQARTAFLQTEEAQDAVGRALAVLASARALEFSEFLRLYASVRMGVCAGQIGGVRVEQLDSLLFAVEPATLLQRAGNPFPPPSSRSAAPSSAAPCFPPRRFCRAFKGRWAVWA